MAVVGSNTRRVSNTAAGKDFPSQASRRFKAKSKSRGCVRAPLPDPHGFHRQQPGPSQGGGRDDGQDARQRIVRAVEQSPVPVGPLQDGLDAFGGAVAQDEGRDVAVEKPSGAGFGHQAGEEVEALAAGAGAAGVEIDVLADAGAVGYHHGDAGIEGAAQQEGLPRCWVSPPLTAFSSPQWTMRGSRVSASTR